MIRRSLLVGLLGGCAIVSNGCSPVPEPKRPERPAETNTAESTAKSDSAAASKPAAKPVTLELASVDDLKKRIDAAKGKVVVVDVLSTACLPCMKEFPNLVDISNKYPDDVLCISFNVDYLGLPKKAPEDSIPAVKKFLEEKQATLTNLLSNEPDSDVLSKLEVESMPAIFIYDRLGGMVAKLTDGSAGENGLTYQEDVLPLVNRLATTKPVQ